MALHRTDSPLWAPLFCKVCSRRAAIIVGGRLLCGDCFFKHSVAELSRPEPEEETKVVSIARPQQSMS